MTTAYGPDGEELGLAETTPELLALMKEGAKKNLNLSRDASIFGGFPWNGYVFDSDITSVAWMVGTCSAINAGVQLPPDFTWRTKNNEDVLMSSADMLELATTLMGFVNYQFRKSWLLKSQVDAATTPEEIAAIVW